MESEMETERKRMAPQGRENLSMRWQELVKRGERERETQKKMELQRRKKNSDTRSGSRLRSGLSSRSRETRMENREAEGLKRKAEMKLMKNYTLDNLAIFHDIKARHFYEDHLESWRRVPRLTCIAYQFDRRTGMVCYAGALFKLDMEDEVRDRFGCKKSLKKELRTTAYKRLNKKPMMVQITGTRNMHELHRMIRKCLGQYGAYCKREEGKVDNSANLQLLYRQ